MANITNAVDKQIQETSAYRAAIDTILKQEQEILATITHDDPNAAFKRLGLADSMLNLASNYVVIDGVVQSVLKLKNEDSLNTARKGIYKSIIYLEEVVSNYVDVPYSDYEDKLKEIDSATPAQRYLLIRKMGLAIYLLESAYGDNTKWKWTFVAMEGRYAAVAKNIINLKDVQVNSNFESEHYEPTVRHLALAKKLLGQAADRYRQKYELSTNRIDDFRLGINFLSALRRLCIVTGDQNEANMTKKKLDIWTAKLEKDSEKQKKEKKA
jgi:hypothetical protein